MKRSVTQAPPEVQVQVRGHVRPDLVDYARTKVLALADQVREPILFAKVKLSQAANPAVPRPAMAQANLDVNGRPARVYVAAKTMPEAVDAMQARLAGQLSRLSQHWESRRARVQNGRPPAEAGEWRHGNEPTPRPDYYPRAAEERRLVRHKTFALARETPDEAAFEMDTMDYDFHLFTDLETGQDSVIYRGGPTGYRLAEVDPQRRPNGPLAVPLTVSEQPAPRMTVEEAEERLEMTGQPFVFFADAGTGRGSVVYHRYDGHYGLITPVE